MSSTDPQRHASPSNAGLTIAIDGSELEGQPTGVGRYLANLLQHWVTLPGHETFRVYHQHPLSVELPQSPRLVLDCVRGAAKRSATYWQQVPWSRAIRKARPDVVFGPAGVLPRGYRGPSVATLHDLSFFAQREGFGRFQGARRRFLCKSAAQQATRLIAVSRFTRDEALRWLDVDPTKLEVIYHGIAANSFSSPGSSSDALQRRLGFDFPFALMVGSIFERRFPTAVLDAMLRIGERSFGLVIVGDDRRRDGGDFEDQIRRRGLEHRVAWLRYASDDDLAGLYRTAHHLIYLSSYEGFGLPPLEAMALGLPTLVSTGGALEEIYGEAAALVTAPRPEQIAQAMERLIESEEHRSDLSRRGRQLAQQLSLARCAEATLAALRRSASQAVTRR